MTFSNPKREQCNHQRRQAGLPYPRTCLVCGLGPCRIDQLQFDFNTSLTRDVIK